VPGHVDTVVLVRGSWDGSVAAGEKIVTDDVYVDHFAPGRMRPAWPWRTGSCSACAGSATCT
jgi:hypothetical protein